MAEQRVLLGLDKEDRSLDVLISSTGESSARQAWRQADTAKDSPKSSAIAEPRLRTESFRDNAAESRKESFRAGTSASPSGLRSGAHDEALKDAMSAMSLLKVADAHVDRVHEHVVNKGNVVSMLGGGTL